MALRGDCYFVVPGDLDTPTGGYRYDRHIVMGLQASGWRVEVVSLQGSFPWPQPQALYSVQQQLKALPDRALVVIDGLAFGALPQLAHAHAQRLRWVALVHHPLWLETGLDAAQQAQLRHSEAWALQAARQVIVTSAATAGDVRALVGPDLPVAVVEPGTDPVIARARTAAGHDAKTPRVLCVASLTPRKGHGVLLEALAGLQHLPWSLHNVGSASRHPATAQGLLSACAALGLGQRVFWHGEVDDTALTAHYAAADLFVLPSWHEGYGMAVAEALAHGLPVVASHAGALAQTLPCAAGRQVAPGDVLALRNALAELIGHPSTRRACAAAAREAGARLPTW
ncbi:MAG: glycosyltransferase family 4 protein, partial [Rubrivivax sp.]